MSYDIYLKEPTTGEMASVPGHLMRGGTYKVEYDPETNRFVQALNTDAHINITYNYGSYYREVYKDGIREIYGVSAADSIEILEKMIQTIKDKYVIKATTEDYWAATPANAIKQLYQLIALAKMRPDCVWAGD